MPERVPYIVIERRRLCGTIGPWVVGVAVDAPAAVKAEWVR